MDKTIRRQINGEFNDEETKISPPETTDQSQHY